MRDLHRGFFTASVKRATLSHLLKMAWMHYSDSTSFLRSSDLWNSGTRGKHAYWRLVFCFFLRRDKHDKNHRPQFHKVGNMDWLAAAWLWKPGVSASTTGTTLWGADVKCKTRSWNGDFFFLIWEPAVGVPKTMLTVLNRFRIGEGSGDKTPYGRWLVEKHFLEIMLLFWWPRYGKVC